MKTDLLPSLFSFISPRSPAFGVPVTHVVTLRSNKKMSGVYAVGDVTRVTNASAVIPIGFRDGAIVHLPANPVRSSVFPADAKPTIPKPIDGTLPKPTGFGFDYIVPKTLSDSHLLLLSIGGNK